LHMKSNTFSTITQFFSFVTTQFGHKVKSVQCNNGCEFDNSSSRQFFLAHGMHLWFSYSYTSPQNGKAEHMLCTSKNNIRTLLFQAFMPPQYWVESLHTATYLLNYLPTKTITASCPYTTLYNTPHTYEHLRVFGCARYPNLSATALHNVAPRFTWCVFIGYSLDHKWYRCLHLSTNRIVTRPPGGPITCVVEADGSPAPSGGLTARLMASSTSLTPRVATMTLASTSTPRVATMTPPSASSMALVSLPASQPMPHVLPADTVPISPVVHPHPMQTRGAASF
jgi:hypothetical protein